MPARHQDALCRIAHAIVPGRVRLRLPELAGDRAGLAALAARVAALPGVAGATPRAATGSLLIFHDGRRDPKRLSEEVRRLMRRSPATRRSNGRAGPVAVLPGGMAPPPPGDVHHAQGRPWHVMDAGDVLHAVRVDPNSGLSPEEAANRLARHGANQLARMRERSDLSILVEQFTTLPTAMLAGSAVLSAGTGGAIDAAVTLAVVLANGFIGFLTEGQAERTLRAFAAPAQHEVAVRRGGVQITLPAEDVVPGDILVLTPGRFVGADGRVIASQTLGVDEAILTGESLPVTKTTAALADADRALADRTNMVFMGTTVSGGSGEAVAVATGADTEIGHVQALAGGAERPVTPVERELGLLGQRLVLVAGGVCAAMFAIGLMRGYPRLAMLKSAIALAVAAVPEGLPTVATTTLALGLKAMERRGVLIRRLDAVEALGALQTVCFDKTGTLTENTMRVRLLHLAGGFVSADELLAGGGPLPGEVSALLDVAVLCNEAHHAAGPDGQDRIAGSATEGALLSLAEMLGRDVDALRQQFPCRHVVYRDGQRKRMTTLHEAGGQTLLAVKGGPEEVLGLCDAVMGPEGPVPLSPEERARILDANTTMAEEGLRVLGFASGRTSAGEVVTEEGLVWLGLAGLADPVRPGLAPLLARFHGAGIRTVMITGDQAGTAAAVARHLGLSGNGPPRVATGSDIERLSPEALAALAPDIDVFARVSPAHKLRIVQALQRAGQIVAMTGDGINDGPALKAADIGIAMGLSGTDVAKDVANVVLRDDGLETLAEAIAQGRSIFANIRKSLRFLLGTNLSEILVTLAETLHGPGELETPLELLWINLVTDVLPGLGLAMLPPDDDVMSAPPRPTGAQVFSWSDMARVASDAALIAGPVTAAHLWGVAQYGPGPRTRAVTFSSLVFSQLAYAFACRHEFGAATHLPVFGSRALNLSVAGATALQALPLLVPGIQRLLGIAPLGARDLPVVAATSLIPFLVAEYWRAPRRA